MLFDFLLLQRRGTLFGQIVHEILYPDSQRPHLQIPARFTKRSVLAFPQLFLPYYGHFHAKRAIQAAINPQIFSSGRFPAHFTKTCRHVFRNLRPRFSRSLQDVSENRHALRLAYRILQPSRIRAGSDLGTRSGRSFTGFCIFWHRLFRHARRGARCLFEKQSPQSVAFLFDRSTGRQLLHVESQAQYHSPHLCQRSWPR